MNKTHIATMGERFFMSKIAIATDSNSGITQAQGRELGIFVMPMPFYINDELFLEDITLSQEQFYQRLEEGADVKTTQPAPGDVLELWDRILAKRSLYSRDMVFSSSSSTSLRRAFTCSETWSSMTAALVPWRLEYLNRIRFLNIHRKFQPFFILPH